MNSKKFFLITSHGQTATLWLAAALNQYGDIFCTHGYAYPPESIEPRNLTREEMIKREEMSRLRFRKLTLHDYLSELTESTSNKLIGNVHAFTYGNLLHLIKEDNWRLSKFGFLVPLLQKRIRKMAISCIPFRKVNRTNLTIVNMVRHPITRVMSMYKCWVNVGGDGVIPFVESDFENRCHHIRAFIKANYKIDMTDQNNKKFIVSLIGIEDITRDVILASSNGHRQIAYEGVTQDIEYFKCLLKEIIGDKLSYDEAKAEQAFLNTPRINGHNNSSLSTPSDILSSWEPWQRDAFMFVSKRNNMKDVYDSFDYELL